MAFSIGKTLAAAIAGAAIAGLAAAPAEAMGGPGGPIAAGLPTPAHGTSMLLSLSGGAHFIMGCTTGGFCFWMPDNAAAVAMAPYGLSAIDQTPLPNPTATSTSTGTTSTGTTSTGTTSTGTTNGGTPPLGACAVAGACSPIPISLPPPIPVTLAPVAP